METELKRAIYQEKLKYNRKWKICLELMVPRKLGHIYKQLLKFKKARTSFELENKTEFSNELNTFYTRYDTQDFRKEQNYLTAILCVKQDSEIIFNKDVDKALKKIKARKAYGSNNICGILLKSYQKQLVPI